MTTETKKLAPAVLWVPSSYLAMGFVLCSLTLSTTFVFKNLGLDQGTITMLAAILTLPYTIKFLWAPILELYRTKKFFVVLMQLCGAVLMALAGLALRLPAWLAVTFGAMMVCSFVGATIDIGTDGVYVTTLDDKQKARWAGIQSMAWTGGQLIAQGALVWLAGKLHDDYGYTWQIAWMYVFLAAAVILAGLAAWHGAFLPPGTKAKDAPKSMGEAMAGFGRAYKTFFQKQLIWRMLALAFFYRFGWYLIEKINGIFLIASRAEGGLGLDNKAAGAISGGWGSASFLAASVLGGLVLAKVTLCRKTLMLFVSALLIPNLAFVWLARSMPDASSYWLITGIYCVAMFAYGFGAVAHMYYMMRQIAPGDYQTAHYAFATGAMGLCNFSAGFISGKIEQAVGFQSYYGIALVCVLTGLLAAWFAPFVHKMDDGSNEKPAEPAPAAS
ncbi:MAG: MFS transporter [Deltaproteobacteria bacterium]|nr:MFS transporter [Deltaproteobacteria bacterium]